MPLELVGGLIAKGIGGILGANAEEAEAEAHAQAAEFNAQTALNNARLVTQQAVEEARKERVMGRKQIGAIRAGYGASGVSAEGSAMDVLQESASVSERNILEIQRGGNNAAEAYRAERFEYLRRAKSYRKGGSLAAAATLLTTGVGVLKDIPFDTGSSKAPSGEAPSGGAFARPSAFGRRGGSAADRLRRG